MNELQTSSLRLAPAQDPFDFPRPPANHPPGVVETPAPDLTEIAQAVTRRWRLLAAWIAACLALAALYLHDTPSQYSASTAVILEAPRQDVNPQTGAAFGFQPTLDSAQTDSQIQVILSERLLSSVFQILDLKDSPQFASRGPSLRSRIAAAFGMTPSTAPSKTSAVQTSAFEAFRDRVSVRRIGESYVLEITYTADSPDEAARIANAVTSAYILSQVNLKAAAAQHGSEYLQERIADIKAEQDAALKGVKEGRIPNIEFPDSDARVIGAALPPLSRSSPQAGLIIAFAIAFGLLTGLFGIAVWHGLDRTLRTRRQVRRALGADCLGVIPDAARLSELKTWSKDSFLGYTVVSEPESRFAAAARAARISISTAIGRGSGPTSHRAIGIVSWSRGEGRSTLAASIAYLIAASGEAVSLIDADLTNPGLTGALTPEARFGLDEALLDHAVAKSLPVRLSAPLSFVPAVGAGRSGDPNAYLGSNEMRALISRLRADGDVVIDLPPLSASSDVQAISPFLDGVVLVVEAAKTTSEQASEAIWALRAANARFVGVFLNKAELTA